MKSSEEIRQYLENLMGWGLDRPWMYGGSPFGTDGVFWYWRLIWSEVMDRTRDFYDATTACKHGAIAEPHIPGDLSRDLSTDPVAYKPVTDFWRAVDQRLGIQHPPAP